MSRHHRRVPQVQWERTRRQVLDAAGWRCEQCGSPIELEVHHVQPLDKGGAALALDNLRALCRGCHIAAHMDSERRRWRQFVRELTA